MTKVYIVRHCEAMGNINDVFQGITDLDITETGAEQLKYLEKRFDGIRLDEVYTSPLLRARKTALAVIGNKNLEPIVDKDLIEINLGVFDGKPFSETFKSVEGLYDIWNNHIEDLNPQGGESMKSVYERAWNTVKKIASDNQGKTVVCSTHGAFVRCLICRLLKNDISKISEIPWSENTAVSLIEFDSELNPTVAFYNDISHLPDGLFYPCK